MVKAKHPVKNKKTKVGRCLNDNQIRSMAIGSMPVAEQCRWGEHLANCANCRTKVAQADSTVTSSRSN